MHNLSETKILSLLFTLTAHSDNDMLAKAKKTEPYGYIVKPFDPINLHTTIQMALYRFKEEKKRNSNIDELKSDREELEKLVYAKKLSDKPIVEFGDGYRHDTGLGETYYQNQKIKLTKKENAFIRLLVAQLGSVVDFEQAINYVWETKGATDNSVRTLVWRLRSKLPSDVIKKCIGSRVLFGRIVPHLNFLVNSDRSTSYASR